MNLFTEAERKIAAILERLEVDTGELVDYVALVDLDITNSENNGQEIIRTVRIITHRVPGARWSK